MDRIRVAFKRCMDQTCAALRIDHGEFNEARHYNDFLIENFPYDGPAQEIAVRALLQLCQYDGSLFDKAVCIAVIRFLDESFGAPAMDKGAFRRTKDLTEMLARPCTEKACKEWIASWYGYG